MTMEVRNGLDAKSGCIERRHGAMSAGEVLEEELCLLPEGCRIGLRVTSEDENEEEESDLSSRWRCLR